MFSMRRSIVWLLFRREVRDQLRDRRTLFMIFVLPIMLYPMLGIGMMKVASMLDQKARTVVIIGAEALPADAPLLNQSGDGFRPDLFEYSAEASLYQVRKVTAKSRETSQEDLKGALRSGDADVVVSIPPDIRSRIRNEKEPFRPALTYDSSSERSRGTARAIREVFNAWNEQIIHQRLERDAKPSSYLQAVQPELVDVARVKGSGENVWARQFPFLLVMMALTGAFYPAVDLCAGEKERGTMETLLISPATRPEIVTGKFLTVMLASMAMAILNLTSMGLTASVLAARFGMQFHGAEGGSPMPAPSLVSMIWMLAILIPLSAFFSALSIALAALARSMKEGQYYLTPLYMFVLPLVFVSLMPIDLNLFNSLIPVTGVSLLLRTLMQGKFEEARHYFLPVLVPLFIYGVMALRWAVDQFQREDVLFRESERFDLRAWLVHMVRDRKPVPTCGEVVFCFAIMLMMAYYAIGWMGTSWQGMVAGQAVFILGPPLVLSFLLTSSPRHTLRLHWSPVGYLALAAGLAIALNPITVELKYYVEGIFPIPKAVQESLQQLMGTLPKSLGVTLFALAIVPAVCEEFAFRGFILSGLESQYRRGTAIVLSAFLFGFMHVLLSLFQQLFNATLLGLVLAMLAIRSRSLLPGIVFHVMNNTLAILIGTTVNEHGIGPWLFRDVVHGRYHFVWVILGGLASLALLAPLVRRPPERKPKQPDEELSPSRSSPSPTVASEVP